MILSGELNSVNAITSSLMSVLLVIHAMLGCCWHHAHACVGQEASAQPTAHGSSCCQHHDCPQRQEQPAAPCGCKIECQGVCIYLPTQKVLIDNSPLAVAFEFAAVDRTLDGSHVPTAISWEVASGAIASSPPLRLHLMHQILLI
jgi:hypothetical protein